MSLIKNLIKEPENKVVSAKADGEEDTEEKNEGQKLRPVVKSAMDLQRLKLDKLMKNPEKPVLIPEPRKEKDYLQSVPSFVRNVMGSSAGAGSGEFHVYRHLRRKEYARQKTIQAKSLKEQLDDEYREKLEENRRQAEERTAKKRAKRLKKKQRAKKARQQNQGGEKILSEDEDHRKVSPESVLPKGSSDESSASSSEEPTSEHCNEEKSTAT